jgi:hypothetical protein
MMGVSRRLIIGISAVCVAAGLFAFEVFSDASGTFLTPKIARILKPARSQQPGSAGQLQSIQLASINPLGSLALESFKETVERPLFNQTRAPKPPQVMAEEPQDGPEEPQANADDFTLLGVVVTETGKTALLRFNKTNEVFRLKDGQTFSDWQVTEIGPRSIVIKKDDLTFPLKLFGSRAPAAVQQPGEQGDDNSDDEESDNQAEAVSRLERPALRRFRQVTSPGYSRTARDSGGRAPRETAIVDQ